MKRSLSVFLSLVLLVSSLVIPMSVSADTISDEDKAVYTGLINSVNALDLDFNFAEANNLLVETAYPIGSQVNEGTSIHVPASIKNTEKVYANTDEDTVPANVGSKYVSVEKNENIKPGFWNINTSHLHTIRCQYDTQPVNGSYPNAGTTGLFSLKDSGYLVVYVKTARPFKLGVNFSNNQATPAVEKDVDATGGYVPVIIDMNNIDWPTLSSDGYATNNKNWGYFLTIRQMTSGEQTITSDDQISFGSVFTIPVDTNVRDFKYIINAAAKPKPTTAKRFDVNATDFDPAAMIVAAEKITNDGRYTADSWKTLQSAIAAAKEAFLRTAIADTANGVSNIKTLLSSELADAGTVEEVWQPRYQHNGSNWNDPVNNVSSSLSGIISGYNNELGSFVTKMNSRNKIVSLVTSDATTSNGDGSIPINVDYYDDMWLYVYNNTSVDLTPDNFLIVSTPNTGSKNGDAKGGLTFPANSLTRIDVAKILKNMNTAMSALYPNWNTNRIQLKIGSLSGTQDVYCGTVLGFKKLDTTALAAATTYADIFKFYAQNVKNNKGLQNAEDAISTFEAIRTSIATSENVDDIKDLLLYELSTVGTVEEIWRPMWKASHDGTQWNFITENAIDDSTIESVKKNFGEFAVKLDSTYQITSVTDAGAPNQQPNVGPFLNVDDYFDIWMYAYNNNSGTIKANNFMVVSAGSNTYGLTAPALNNGLNRIELYNNLVAASTGIKADKDGTKNMVRLQIQYNTNKIPEGAAVYYGSVLGVKRIDTSELQTAERMADIIEFYDNNIGEKSLVDANGVASTEAKNLVNSIRGGLSPIKATLNDDTFVTPTADCPYTLKYAKLGAEFKFNLDVKNGGAVNSVTYGGETVAPVGDVYTITVNNAKTLVITTDRDTYATVDGKLTVESGDQRDIFNHSTSNNQSTWSTKKDKINGESVVYQESVLFYEGRSNVKLMYPVSNIVAVTSYSTVNGKFVRYYKDEDFVVNDDGTISLTADSSIPHSITLEEIKTGTQGKDIWNSASIWDKELPKNHVLVTYTYKDTWKGVDYDMPTYVNKLTTAYDKLNDGNEALDVLFIGDSITTGCNASGQSGEFYSYTTNAVGPKNTVQGWKKYLGLNVDSAPYWVNDSWDKQVVANLKEMYGGTINVKNRAVGSSASGWYLNNIETLLSAGGPTGNDSLSLQDTDLVFIGFGMNEANDTVSHVKYMKELIEYLRRQNPNVSIVLVSAFYPTFWKNEEWTNYKLGEYEDAYFELAKEYKNIAVAPVNTAFTNILKAKEGVDYIANGVNHPNDYGVNLYANVINSTLVGSASIDAPNAMYLYNDKSGGGNGKATYNDERDGAEKTAVYLFAQYKSPVDNEGKLDPTKIILSDGTEGTVVSRTIYLATKTTAEKLGDNFGKVTSDKVKSSTVSGDDLKKCWANEDITDSSNKLVTYGVKAHGIIKANSDKPLAVRAKIEYTVGTDKYTIYSNVRTSDYFSAQGAYAHLKGQNNAPVWFAN